MRWPWGVRRWGKQSPTPNASPLRGELLLGALGAGLAGLAAHALSAIADAFALVRLRLAQLANFRGRLADTLLVDPADGDDGVTGLRVVRHLVGDAVARRHLDQMRVADR